MINFRSDMKKLFLLDCKGYGSNVDIGKILRGILNLVRLHKITIDANYATLVMNCLCLDSMATSLLPSYSLLDNAKPLLKLNRVFGRLPGVNVCVCVCYVYVYYVMSMILFLSYLLFTYFSFYFLSSILFVYSFFNRIFLFIESCDTSSTMVEKEKRSFIFKKRTRFFIEYKSYLIKKIHIMRCLSSLLYVFIFFFVCSKDIS